MSDFYKEVGRRIESYRKGLKMSAEELGNRIGVQKKAVRRYELGETKISHPRLEQIADALGIDINALYGEQLDIEVIKVPLYGQISCGDGVISYETVEDKIETPYSWVSNGNFIYLTAKGQSMTGANVQEGDLLLVKKQEEVNNGEIAAVVIDDSAFLKRVYRSDNKFTLVSDNPNYPPVTFDPSTDKNIRIIGKLKKSITSF